MATLAIPTDPRSALHTLCLFLAQSEAPHMELGFSSQIAAFEAIGAKFGVPKNTVKNKRDAFDNYTDSGRSGWNKDLGPSLKQIFDKYSKVSRAELRDISLRIMKTEWEPIRSEDRDEMDDQAKLDAGFTLPPQRVTLPDLEACQRLSKERAAGIQIDRVCAPSPEVWGQIVELYIAEVPSDKVVVVGGSAMSIETGNDKILTISAQEFPRCWAVRPYVLGILKYEEKVDQLARVLGFANRSSGRAREEIFKKLPAQTWEADLSAEDVVAIKDAVEQKLGLSSIEQDRFLKFLTDSKWSGVSKTLERSDWPVSAIVGAGGWLANASTRRGELAIALAKSEGFEELMQVASSENQASDEPLTKASVLSMKGGENVIFYGAPGTGKSNCVEQKINAVGKKPFRTVFHPDLQNSDFFGCLKPQMEGDQVRYAFAAGPFMKALAQAYLSPSEPVFLVIEELNRAAAAAVFGDLFLLLDRDDDGNGEYDVSFPSPESETWFKAVTGLAHESLRLPSNLFIYATMNSADQGVYPIDTAFRRRWRQEYLPLDYQKGPSGDVSYVDATGNHHSLPWRSFIQTLNGHLTAGKTLGIAEDRLLGQWFVKSNELCGQGIPDKVLLYLWDDLLRHDGRAHVFNSGSTGDIHTYGDLVIAADANRRFLSDDFLEKLNAAVASRLAQSDTTIENAS